jgi:3-deoxy-D-manno-octulosonic-acid transferase
VLFTTTTVTAARFVEQRLPPGGIHQFLPLDHQPWVRRFLDHWRPDWVLWVESDFWPGHMAELRRRGIPAALVNARISRRSMERWQRFPDMMRQTLSAFSPCLAASPQQAKRLASLGANGPRYVGNLKAAVLPPLQNTPERRALQGALRQRTCWLAASTHPGEERAALRAHQHLKSTHPGLLTLLAPRHISRAGIIAAEATAAGLKVARHSQRRVPGPDHDIYLVDSLGELGLFYEAAPVCFIGGSLADHAGHNPFEAIHSHSAVIHGPCVQNFQEVYDQLRELGAACCISNSQELAAAVHTLLTNPAQAADMATHALQLRDLQGDVVETIYRELEPLFARP